MILNNMVIIKQKFLFDAIRRLEAKPDGKLVLVTAITPNTRQGKEVYNEHWSCTRLTKNGQNAIATLREPSLGSCIWH